MIFTRKADGETVLLTSQSTGISESGDPVNLPREFEVLQEDSIPGTALNSFKEVGESIHRAGATPSRFWNATSLQDLRP